MADDRKPETKPDERMPGDATPHNPGLTPKPGDPAGQGKPPEAGPYDKKEDPAQQPT